MSSGCTVQDARTGLQWDCWRLLRQPVRQAHQGDCKVFSNSEVLGNSLATITSFPRRRESRSAINQQRFLPATSLDSRLRGKDDARSDEPLDFAIVLPSPCCHGRAARYN